MVVGGSHWRQLRGARVGGIVVDHGRVLLGFVAWRCHVVVIVVLVGVGCERSAVHMGIGGCWQRVVTWRRWVVVNKGGGGGKTNRVYCLFVICGAKLNVGVCRKSTWTIHLLID